MSSNSNKVSSFVGVILLFLVIAFTIFINFFAKEPAKEIKTESEVIEEYLVLDSTVLSHLWKLEGLQTKFINVNRNKQKTQIHINKNLEVINRDNTTYSQRNNFTKQPVDEIHSNNDEDNSINYGILNFINSHNKGRINGFTDFRVEYYNLQSADAIKLRRIGNTILDYQIDSIITESKLGNFTQIKLKDGRSVFLMKKNTEIKNRYYKQVVENAEYLNDSTKVIYLY
ncbi:hypothetical protein [Bernardetia sp.]|uniref:hypothetical protein n=1 Tax=Bernardetia sp. TaxID=1937974 RepID=UPI0025BA7D3C|nr:hypothetical protein [Bernardetia sp.]